MITVQLLGGASLRAGETLLGGPPAQRHRLALLALLAAAWPQPLSRDRAMVLLWPERETASARRLLNLAVHVLRTALGEDAIVSSADGLLLDASRLRCDLLDLHAAIAAGRPDEIARLHSGPFLDGFHLSESTEFGYWVDQRRAELEHAYAGALLAIAREQERAGDVHGWIGSCRKLVAADPYSGAYAQALMRALDAAGDRAAAIQHASEHARRLQAELELEADPDVLALAERLRRAPTRPRAERLALAPVRDDDAGEPAPQRPFEPPLLAPESAPHDTAARDDSSAATSSPAPLVAPAPPRRVRRRLGRWTLAGSLVVLALAAYAVFRWRSVASPPPASAAVLPFVDLSPGGDQEYFSDGLTDELITTLSKVPGLRVAARTSSFQFKGRSPDVHEVGRRLGVGAVLEGSVRRSGDRLRVTAALIDAANGYRLWSESYDRDVSDVFAVQEDVARSIVSALRVRLAPGHDSALAVRPTHDLRAYDLYLEGLFAWNQRTGPALRDAVGYLQQAVALDSSFARAWAALAEAYLLQYPYGGGGSPRVAWERARAAATRALALDPTSAEAHTALGYGNMIYAWDWVAAESSFRRAIAVDPNYATGHHWYGDFLAGRGRLDESLAQFRTAGRLDPLSRQIGTEWGWVSYLGHRNDEAAAHIRQMLELEPNYAQAYLRLGFVEIQQRRYPDAIASIERSVDLGVFRPQALGALAFAYAASGQRERARRLVDDLVRQHDAHEFVPPWAIAVGYAGLGETARGIAWLNRGVDEKDVYMPENFFDPLLDPLRSDPGYPQLVARMGISAGR